MTSLINLCETRENDVTIRHYIDDYNQGRFTLPKWQRGDGWENMNDGTPECQGYKADFIKALLEGVRIPKIYHYKGEKGPDQILDGGHRTRAIDEFIKGEFPIKLNDGNFYYFTKVKEDKKRSPGSGQSLTLPDELKKKLLNTTLTLVVETCDETTARKRFNQLNHNRPMEKGEVINSWSSPLVDNLRDYWENQDDKKEFCDMFCEKESNLQKKHKWFLLLTAVYSLTSNEQTFTNCEPKNALGYIQSPEMNDEWMEESWPQFETYIQRFKDFYNLYRDEGKCWVKNKSEALSLFYYVCVKSKNEPLNTLYQKVNNFFEMKEPYMKNLSEIQKKQSSKTVTPEQKKVLADEEKTLKAGVHKLVIDWTDTFRNNGSGKRNMEQRESILENLQLLN